MEAESCELPDDMGAFYKEAMDKVDNDSVKQKMGEFQEHLMHLAEGKEAS